MGNIVLKRMKLVDVAVPHMKSLSDLSGETVLLTVVNDWDAMCIEKIETNRLIKLSLEQGSRLPLHAGASSKILLAYMEDSFVTGMFENVRLTKFTENTITDHNQLRKELKKIREQGYAFSDSEVDLLARAIGAPIFNYKGAIVAGITVAGPAVRLDNEYVPKVIDMVKDSAVKVSCDLGYVSKVN